MIAGLILAGGKGLRMGGLDKPLLRLGDRALLDILADRLAPQVGPVAISANGDPRRFAAASLSVLSDDVPDQGPLAGVLTGLRWAAAQGCTALLTVPGDTPFIPSDLAVRLWPPAATARSGGRTHHAVALWPVGCGDALKAYLDGSGSRSVARFARALPSRAIDFPVGGAIDPFFNINTPDDLLTARAWWPGPPAG
ncbi:molybdenum cofactor guanylyltransferase MobA [Lichenicoccus sp.]|uniref:molybdenum cofactor guanylyltransferase MobA n=1 Tax=Lichenicoccus sp. TaxID=2781899 RepID=UPI003D0E3F75